MDPEEYQELEANYHQYLSDLWDKIVFPPDLDRYSIIFFDWIQTRSNTELENAIKAFEHLEMYEECSIIRDHLLNMKK